MLFSKHVSEACRQGSPRAIGHAADLAIAYPSSGQTTDDAPARLQAISTLRAAAAHQPYDAGILDASGNAHITNGDSNSIVIGRTPSQVTTWAFGLRRAMQKITLTAVFVTFGPGSDLEMVIAADGDRPSVGVIAAPGRPRPTPTCVLGTGTQQARLLAFERYQGCQSHSR